MEGGRHSGVVGREPEFALLRRVLERTAEGPEAVILHGHPGIGKTTLWDWTLREAAQRSWRVLSDRAAAAETRLTYVVLSDLLADVPDSAYRELSPPLRDALEIALLRARPGRGRLAQRAVAAGFLALLEGLAAAGPVLVAVDDAQWLDGPSAALLEFAARRLRTQPVLFLLAQRSDDPEPFSYDRAFAEPARVELGPLSLGALHQLIRSRLGSPLPRRQLVEVERLSGGNPLFALELARAFRDLAGPGAGPPPLPATLGEALLTRVRALPPPARRSLLIAALAAEPRAEFADPSGLVLAEAAALVATGPDGSMGFTHPLIAWAVERSATQAERRAAHLELADRVADPEEAIRHRALAAEGPDPVLAAELERAALAAQARGAPAAATELLADARRLSPEADLDTWARLVAAEIPLQLEAGDWVQAWELGQEALERLPPGPARAALLLEAVEHRPGSDDLCRQALAEAGDDPGLRIRGELALALQRLYAFDGAGARPHSETAVELARRSGAKPLLDLAVTHRGIIAFLFGDGDPRPDFAEALAIEAELGGRLLPVAMSASCYRGLWLMCTGELEVARVELEELLGLAIDVGDEGSQAQLLSFLGALEMRAGNWSAARELIESATRVADLLEFAQGRAEKRGWLALLLARQGELDAARSNATEAMTICAAIGDRFTSVLVLEALAAIAASLDDPAGVMEHVEGIHEILSPQLDPPVWTEFEGDELEALVALGRLVEARTRLAALRRRLGARPTPDLEHWVARGTARLAAADGDLETALSALRGALAAQGTFAPFEYARTLLLRGQIERRARRRAAARASLEEAAGILERLGARAWAERARVELDRIGAPRTASGLTATEQRVARLAARGRTNREIATELFISRRTVETNLQRVYRKLDVNSRVELASLLAAGPGE